MRGKDLKAHEAAHAALLEYFHDPIDGGWAGHHVTGELCHTCRTSAQLAVEAAAKEIAYRIRAELVCCNQFQDLEPLRREIEVGRPGYAEAQVELDNAIILHGHGICYWGEAAALLAEEMGRHGKVD